ncbi:MAG: hypothetical protein RLZZ58_636 [Pseudomonadota bacterium]|jgi:hypothetical protein
MKKFALALPAFILAALAVSADGQTADAPFLHVERGAAFESLQDAVDSVGDGQGTIRIASGVHGDCAVQTQGRIAFVAASPGAAVFDGVTCEGKAALVLRGRGAVVDGLVFQNMRVADGNGAGIRLEKSNLDIVNSMFRNSEEGLLTADDPAASIRIDKSTFSRLGRCDRGLSCAHSVYTGIFAKLVVTRSRFERGTGGHYLKSRAIRVDVSDNSFDDTRGTTTNYMIDLPSGSVGAIRGNVFVQGKDKENYSAFIAVAAEERKNPSNGLLIADNRASIVPGVERRSFFVADWSGAKLAVGVNDLGTGLAVYERR